MVKLSKTSKMPGRSWGLPAGSTCPGSHDATGAVVDVCKACYAKTGFYTYPNVRNAREFNRTDWKRVEWVADMISEVQNERYFRWFDSGDVYHPALAFKILLVVRGTPDTQHWLPTRSGEIARIRVVLDQINSEPNAVVRYSSDSITGEFAPGQGSTVIPIADWPTAAQVCVAPEQGGKCLDCRACWDKNVEAVAYVGHGLVMSHKKKRILRERALDAA
jgi:hypothetical protein